MTNAPIHITKTPTHPQWATWNHPDPPEWWWTCNICHHADYTHTHTDTIHAALAHNCTKPALP